MTVAPRRFAYRIELPVIVLGLLVIVLAAVWALRQRDAAQQATTARMAAADAALAIEKAAGHYQGSYATLDGADETKLRQAGSYRGSPSARVLVHARAGSWCAQIRVAGAADGWSQAAIRSGEREAQKGGRCR